MALNLSTILSTSTSGNKKQYRRIFVGPATETWIVPEGTYEVEVNVFGGGGNGGNAASGTVAPNPFTPSGFYQIGGTGGGGGGFARHLYKVNPGDVLSIVVGGRGGTSSVNVPTQAPTLPISATGGSSGGPGGAESGTGGTGSIASIPAPLRSGITTSYSGGKGSNNSGAPNGYFTSGGGGGASGFIYGNGQDGSPGQSFPYPSPSPFGPFSGGLGGNIFGTIVQPQNIGSTRMYQDFYTTSPGSGSAIGWFYLEDLIGENETLVSFERAVGQNSASPSLSSNDQTNDYYYIGKSTPVYSSRAFAGSNGSGSSQNPPPAGDAPATYSARNNLFCGGGGGGGWYAGAPADTKSPRIGSLGGVGLVIIYW